MAYLKDELGRIHSALLYQKNRLEELEGTKDEKLEELWQAVADIESRVWQHTWWLAAVSVILFLDLVRTL